VQFGMDPPKLN